jgi:hypothetical protein
MIIIKEVTMKKNLILLFSLIILAAVVYTGCDLGGGDGGIDVDENLVGSWVQTDTLDGPWTDFGIDPKYLGWRFASGGKIYMIYSNDGMSWDEAYTGINLTLAEGGDWETDAGGWGTYTFSGNDMTWVNNATAVTAYYERL